MSFKKRNRIERDTAVNMTPMLDIVFILLIFFIVTSVFLDERGLDFKIPANNIESPIKPLPAIQIVIDSQNRISVDENRIELSAVAFAVEGLLADKPNAAIVLIADHRAKWDPVLTIRDKMDAAGRKTTLKIIRT